MKRVKVIAKASIKAESGYIHYKLLRLRLAKHSFYLIFISYNGESRLCAFECKEGEAKDIFTSIIRTRTTPISLYDSIYDLQK